MPVREQDFHREIVNMFNQIRYEWRTNPVILGGSSGSEGGSTGSPGGTIGQVGQRSVAGDTSEGPFLISSGSINSLLDNLKRIRYWELPSRQFGLEEHVPAEATWIVSSGSWYHTTATDPLIYLGGDTPPITLPSSGSRLDLLTISTSGILQWLSGTSGSAPTMPTPPSVTSGSMPLWAVVIRASGSACHNYDQGTTSHYIFRDMRPFLDWGIGGAGGSSGSFVPGSIPFGSGSGVLTEENQYLYWDTIYKRLMRGSNTFGAYEAAFGFPGIYNININNDGSGFVPIAYGTGSPGITGIKIPGSIASPTAVQTNDILVRMSGRGWGSTGLGSASRTRVESVATENWTDSAQGAKIDFYTTNTGGTTVTKAVTVTESQGLQIHNLTATDNRIPYLSTTGVISQAVLKYSNASNTTNISPPDVGIATPTALKVSGGAASTAAGDLILKGGDSLNSGYIAGSTIIEAGVPADSVSSGSVKIRDSISGISAILQTSSLSGSDKTYTLPNRSGKLIVDGTDWRSGTSFPASPGTGDKFFRNDLGWLCYYDGTRWLTDYEIGSSFNQISTGASADVTYYLATLRTDYAVYVSRVKLDTLVITTNNGTNYWTVSVVGYNLAYNATTTVYSFTTASDTVNVFTLHEGSASTPNPTNKNSLALVIAKTLAPGTLYLSCTVYHRLIVT